MQRVYQKRTRVKYTFRIGGFPSKLSQSHTKQSRLRSLLIYGSLAALALYSSLFLVKNVDLRVYWYGVNGFFSGTRPAYGHDSGLGFPMEYRYPPITYLILYPLRYISLRLAGFCWILSAWIVAIATVSLAIHIRRLRFSGTAVVACCAFTLAYLVLAIRYANVQPFIICFIFAALIFSESHPLWAGMLLSLAITFKIWPLLFFPWFFHRARLRAAIYSTLWLIALWIFPVLIFGAARYWLLLHDWYVAVARVGTTYSEFYYFPSQSLRGLLLRYFTPVTPPLQTFPRMNVLSLPPHAAVVCWGIISLIVYCFFVVHLLRSNQQKLWAWDGLAFVLYSLLEPYAVKSGLISLAPAALIAACLFTLGSSENLTSIRVTASTLRSISWANRFFLAACLLSFLGAIVQHKPWQRVLLTIGLDFWAEILLLIALFLWIVRTPLPESLNLPRSPEPRKN